VLRGGRRECGKNRNLYAGFEVFTAVSMMTTVFWGMTPCSLKLTEVSGIGGEELLHILDPKISSETAKRRRVSVGLDVVTACEHVAAGMCVSRWMRAPPPLRSGRGYLTVREPAWCSKRYTSGCREATLLFDTRSGSDINNDPQDYVDLPPSARWLVFFRLPPLSSSIS
jgi:hypothetical protein